MVSHILESLTSAMSGNFQIALVASLAWGVISILLSPCHLSSIPLIVGYISRQEEPSVKRSFGLSFIFAMGILITIAIVGVITVSLGRLVGDVGVWGNLFVAVIFIVVGLYLLDVIKLSWSGIQMHGSKIRGWIGALVLGLIFGIALGPCTFAFMAPVLGLVFNLSASSPARALLLIAAFGLGHCAVIVTAGSLANLVRIYLNWSEESKAVTNLRRVAGILVILGGLYFIYSIIPTF